MIARVIYTDRVEPEIQPALREGVTRFAKPTLTQQEGLVSAFWSSADDGRMVSVTIWESTELMKRAELAMNVPAKPGQPHVQVPPQRVEVYEVWEHLSGNEPAVTGKS